MLPSHPTPPSTANRQPGTDLMAASPPQTTSPDLSKGSVCSGSPPASATSAATAHSSATTLSRRSSNSSISELPSSAYDGSHLHWKAFRQHVLAPHGIRVLENPPKGQLPGTFLSLVEARSKNVERFRAQKTCFREQVNEGRGFGPSPLFPPNLLPSIDDRPRLARCMVPQFSRDALPERTPSLSAPIYELSVPRPGLGCGFSSLAFTSEETTILPSCLVGTGTSVDFSTGYISPSHAAYCPFLIFERAYGNKEHRLEAANNQCAIGGAYCCRALQILYAKAYREDGRPPTPVSFSCTVDNDFAIINHHWIDHEQAYHMAPLCKFDLRQDQHFSHFAAWIDAIGDWALANVLPQVRKALSKLHSAERPSPGYVEMRAAKKIAFATTESNKNDALIKSLKTTFDNIPWRFEDDEFTPVSSATASWGSPLVDDMLISNLQYPSVPRGQLLIRNGQEPSDSPKTSLVDMRMAVSPPLKGSASPTPPAYTYNPELVSHKRLDHAMDEIRELHAQLEYIKRSSTNVDKELAGLRNTLSTVLRKESTTIRTRSLLARRASSPAEIVPSSPTDADQVIPQPESVQQLRPHRPAPLHIRTDLGPPAPSRLKQSTLPPDSPPPAASTSSGPKTAPPPERSSTPMLTLSCNGVDVLLSPTHVKQNPQTPSFDSHKSPLSARAPWSSIPRTPITTMHVETPPLPSPKKPPPQKMPFYQSWYENGSPESKAVLRIASMVISGYVLVALVPTDVVKWFAVGCAADYCMRAITDDGCCIGGLWSTSIPKKSRFKKA